MFQQDFLKYNFSCLIVLGFVSHLC